VIDQDSIPPLGSEGDSYTVTLPLGKQHVHQAIVEVMKLLQKQGISKGRKNTQQNYTFRGIDDVYNAVSSAIAQAQLTILPHYTERTVVERTSANDKALFYVTVVGYYEFVSAVDGSSVVVGPFYGEAMDSGDKATNKAMSAAYKYCCMQTFCIPTEGDNDADATTHEIKKVPEVPVDVWTLLDDASAEGNKPLSKAWKSLSLDTRDLIVQHNADRWRKVKETAAANTATEKAPEEAAT
jgi:hypothetical protein